ncbi:MAG: oxidase [Betaproteobacteria bacterium]|nr:oxidase [Betaproteobacteria bacterium]
MHYQPITISDRIALTFTKSMRFIADTFFKRRYGHRAVVLETVAGVPGMVAGMWTHLTSLRRMRVGYGPKIRTLLAEAENERMHLMTFIEIAKPNLFERYLVLIAQAIFWNLFFVIYVFFPRTAHRIVGYFEEEAVYSYTEYLKEIDSGRTPNIPAPKIAIDYWKLAPDATLRDVVIAVREDEAHHRDTNHQFAKEYDEQRKTSQSMEGITSNELQRKSNARKFS